MGNSPSITVDRKAFAEAVGKVARFLPERAPVPVLRGILVEVEAGAVRLTVTDYEDTARTTVPASVEQTGRVLVDGARFARVVRNLPGNTAHVAVDGMFVVVTSGPATFRLLTMPESDFPNMDGVEATPLGKPSAADGVERALSRPESFVKGFRKPWKASRTTRLYEPTGLQPGAWITWERRTPVPGTTTRHETETVTGQVWSAAPGSCAVWALVEGERSPVLVQTSKYTGAYEIVERKPVALAA